HLYLYPRHPHSFPTRRSSDLTKGVTDSTYRVQYDALWLQLLSVDTLPPLVTSLFTVVGMILVMLVLDLELALIATAVAPFMLLLDRKSTRLNSSHVSISYAVF